MKEIQKDILVLACLLLIHQIFVFFVSNSLYPIYFAGQNIFFLDLIGLPISIPYQLINVFSLGNIVLLWLVGKKLFKSNFYFIPSLIYSLLPWSVYLVIAGSFYVFLSFLVMLIFYSLMLIISEKRIPGIILLVVGVTIALYASFLFLIILPIIFAFIILFRIYSFKKLKGLFLLLIILALPLFVLINTHKVGFKNIANNEAQILVDPGLLDMVNKYQGDAQKRGFGVASKLSENKYVFYLEFFFLKYIKQLVPSTFFTPQEKLLTFSFMSPIYFGFLIPFIYGLYKLLKFSQLRKLLFISTGLVLPSLLSKFAVDLSRLILFAPVIIFVITFGLFNMYRKRKSKKMYLFMILTISLVIIQMIITFSDISFRERSRFVQYRGEEARR